MEKTYESKRHELETGYWLFESRRDILLKLVRTINARPLSKILDIGCAGGHLINFFKEKGFKDLTGLDISFEAVTLCKKRGIAKVFVGDCIETPFDCNIFDVIVADNVLEHIENDSTALKEWNRILKKDGKLIVFVPAYNFLWSQHDEILHHHRRYSKSELIAALDKANFVVENSSYWNFFLFFPACVIRIFQRTLLKRDNKKSDQLYELNNIANRLLIILLRFENWILKRLNFPFGVSAFAVARKAAVKTPC